MKEKEIIFTAKVLSVLFTPFYLPILGLLILFIFSYLSLLPLTYKLFLLLMFYLFTVFLPTALIRFYRRYQGWTLIELGSRERRAIPYVISIFSYLLCYYIMAATHVPHFMGSILIAALVIQVACAIINLFIKISTHTAAIGGVTGALLAFSVIFSFNPVWWLCIVLLLAGMVGTSRMILRQHSLRQVVLGYLAGVACSFVSVLLF
ncbi:MULTISPECIES: phosphatase PAP2 family protein [Prevotellaceae]|jgi:membrane-associated phospholipid phosphatase|uniref:Membrane protein n=1 Tax=Xylanibacter rarus TaxID=1676614 RepID=A0A8E1R0U4_9BACT|nr:MULTISPECIES: phosphatase PAP2 family protein [Prevotellaceae]KOO69459.1 membrane protein [Xylanibacter rarus]MBS5875802.1 phosphatase PAP2 family protein [Prevotella sp.]HJH75916.1 phosphatase PAP2 family protein [Prevotellaceae bacterium]